MNAQKSRSRRIQQRWQQADELINRADLATLPRLQAVLVGIARGVIGIAREGMEGQLNLRAMSLVYTTLLSVVPLLALSFSVLKAFGAHAAIEPLLLNLLEPLGEERFTITRDVLIFVDNIQVGVLGFVGLIFLVYTVIALVQKIESAFNAIWHVEGTRSLGQRFSNYLSVILIGPVLVVSALGVMATVMSTTLMQQIAEIEPLGTIFAAISSLLPFVLIIAAFAFIYIFVPNTRVRLVPALIGALVAGFLWQAAGWGFAAMMAGSTRFDAIYSGFAILIMLLIWIYIAWLILLVGSNIAFYIQYPEYMRVRGTEIPLSGAMRERLGLHLMTQVGQRFLAGQRPPSVEDVARTLQVPRRPVVETARLLRDAGLLVLVDEDGLRYLPARDLAEIEVDEVLSALRYNEADRHYQRLEGLPVVETLVSRIEASHSEVLASMSLRDLLTRPPDSVA